MKTIFIIIVFIPFGLPDSFGQVNNYISINEARLIAEKKIVEVYGQSFLDSNVTFDEERSYPFYALNPITWQDRGKDLWNDVPEAYFINELPKLARCFVVAFDISFDSVKSCDDCLIVHIDSLGRIIRPYKNAGLDQTNKEEHKGNLQLTKQDYINIASKYGYDLSEAKKSIFTTEGVELIWLNKGKSSMLAVSVKYCIGKKGGWLTKEWLLDPWSKKLIKRNSTIYRWHT